MNQEQADKPLEDRKDDNNDAKPYLALLEAAEKQGVQWNQACDAASKAYANLKDLRNLAQGDPEFQIFWANMEVIKPSIYARPPVPVVTTAFKERDKLARTASEVVERVLIANMRKTDGHKQLCLVRDDLALFARGVLWVDHDKEAYGSECAPFVHLLRSNFLHDPQANWQLVQWVARAGYFTMDAAKKRFKGQHINWDDVKFESGDNDTPEGYDVEKTCKVWQIWDKRAKKVIWVAENYETILEQGPPKLKLRTFWPCPEPAYGTKEPETLTSVPDWLFYADQVEEINRYTRRINNLVDQIKLQGFYEAGAENVAAALQRVLDSNDDKILVPITGLNAIDGRKDLVQWLPLGEVIQAVQAMVEIRQQLIQDIYEITGISDIMRGQTQASETLGAQKLKTQYGNVRIRSRQEEMVRIAHEAIEIAAEIAAENFDLQTFIDMTRVELPRDAELAKIYAEQSKMIDAQAQQAAQTMRAQAMQQQAQPPAPGPQGLSPQPQQPPPDPIAEARKSKEQLKAQLDEQITWEDVQEFLRSEKLNAFAMDIETDSTIQADEQAEKENRTQFTAAVGQFLQQASAVIEAAPEAGPLIGELLQFSTAPWRVGRQLESTIDELVEQMRSKAKAAAEGQGGPSPEQIQAEADAKSQAAEAEAKKADAAAKATQEQSKAQEEQFKREQQAKDNEAKRMADMQAKAKVAEADVMRAERKAAADDARAEAEHTRRLENLAAEDVRAAEKHARELERMHVDAANKAAAEANKGRDNER